MQRLKSAKVHHQQVIMEKTDSWQHQIEIGENCSKESNKREKSKLRYLKLRYVMLGYMTVIATYNRRHVSDKGRNRATATIANKQMKRNE